MKPGAALETREPKFRAPRISRLLLVMFSLIFSLALAETTLRLCFHARFSPGREDTSPLYRYDESLGWFPAASSTIQFKGANRTITATHNSEGFRGPERATNGRPAIMVLGDS